MVNWILDNWILLVTFLCVLILLITYSFNYMNTSKMEKIAKFKEWLLYAVIMAEKELGSGTGALKLRWVYNLFLEKFPSLASIITFERFSQYVDEVLDEMKHLLQTNKSIELYVEGEDGK